MVEASEREEKRKRAQAWVVVLVIAMALGSALYRWEMDEGLGHSAALFIGIPLLLAILLAMTPRAKSATGGILKGITLSLLIAAPLVGEGYLCILMAAPLFLAVGVVIGTLLDESKVRKHRTLSCLALLLLPLCLEGTSPELSFDRQGSATATAIVRGSAGEVEHALARSPLLEVALPRVLRIGFPKPLGAWGEGLDVGAERRIHFAGAEGDPPGDLEMRVMESHAGYVRFATVSDTSKLTQWLHWESSDVTWRPVDATHTQVKWTIHFQRELDPKWYFAPMERAAVYEAARYLIAANATPRGAH